MKIKQVMDAVTEWDDMGAKGLLFVHRTITGDMKVWSKHVVKLHELPPEMAAAASYLVESLGAKYIEIKTKEGHADRIEFTSYYKGNGHGSNGNGNG